MAKKVKKKSALNGFNKDQITIGAFIVIIILIIVLFVKVSNVNSKIDSRIGERDPSEGALEGKVYFTEKNLFFNEGAAECNNFCQDIKCSTEEYDGYDGKYKLDGRVCSCQCYKLVK